MPIYQVYYNNGEEYEEYEQYDVLCTELSIAMNFRPDDGEELELLYEYLPKDSGYFRAVRKWQWNSKDKNWKLIWQKGLTKSSSL